MNKSEWDRLGELEADSIHYWYRQKYNLPLTDPRYTNATPDQIRLEFYADIAWQIKRLREQDPDFDLEAELENRKFIEKAKSEPGFIEDWCKEMERKLAENNEEFRDEEGKFTTEKIEALNPEPAHTKEVTLEEIEQAEEEVRKKDGCKKS